MHDDPVSATQTAGHDRWLAAGTAGALDAARWLSGTGLALGLFNLFFVVQIIATSHQPAYRTIIAIILAAIIILLLALQIRTGIRIAIDRRLFGALASSAQAEDLAALDAALASLGWLNANRAGRPLALRAQGALRFLKWAGMLAILQLIATAVLLPCMLPGGPF